MRQVQRLEQVKIRRPKWKQIVREIQDLLYFHPHGTGKYKRFYKADKHWDADTLAGLGEIMRRHNLIPVDGVLPDPTQITRPVGGPSEWEDIIDPTRRSR
jgi:hypothetical protein